MIFFVNYISKLKACSKLIAFDVFFYSFVSYSEKKIIDLSSWGFSVAAIMRIKGK